MSKNAHAAANSSVT